jgi:hypothetical protein
MFAGNKNLSHRMKYVGQKYPETTYGFGHKNIHQSKAREKADGNTDDLGEITQNNVENSKWRPVGLKK